MGYIVIYLLRGNYYVFIYEVIMMVDLLEVTAVRMIVENIQSNQDNINSPPNTTQTGSYKFEDTKEDVTEIETINTYMFDHAIK